MQRRTDTTLGDPARRGEGQGRLIVKPLAPSRRLLVASPDYIERFGLPRTADHHERHKAILYTNRGNEDWRFGNPRAPSEPANSA